MSGFSKSKAERRNVKLMVGIQGPAGSGKTYSALQLAYGLAGSWEAITLADTENGSALYYAGKEHTGDWEHIPFNADFPKGYSPENYVKLIEYAEKDPKTQVLILDSISHEWEGVGGCLDMADMIAKGARGQGNTFTAWKTVTPLHRAFIDKMRNTRLHVIATMRSAQEYVVEKNEQTGKSTPKKMGLKAKTREGTDYEFGVIFEVDMAHQALAAKDRTGLFRSEVPFQIDLETGKTLLAWANGGKAEIYTGENDQKKTFAAEANACGIRDKETMAKLAESFLGKPLDQLSHYFLEYLAIEEQKRRLAAAAEAGK